MSANPVPFAGFVTGVAGAYGAELLGGAQRAVSYTANAITPNMSLGFEGYIKLFQMGLLSAREFYNHVIALGYKPNRYPNYDYNWCTATASGLLTVNAKIVTDRFNDVDRAISLMKNFPSPDEILLLVNRELIDDRLATFLMNLNFGGERDLSKAWMSLREQIPGPSDLIAFAVRDSFTPEIVETFQYNKELPEEILPWMKKQGLGGFSGAKMPPGSTTTNGADNRKLAQWFDHYWWSHWQLPSVGQGYEMLQRLYKDSLHGPSPYANNKTYFIPENLELLQKANDFPPFWRERLQAIAYTPLGRIDIKRMYSIGILREDNNFHEVFHAYKQIGYNDIDADRLTRFVVLQARKDITQPTVQEIDKLYETGAIEKDKAIRLLMNLFYRYDEAEAHFENLDLKIKSAQITALVTQARKAYLNADIGRDEVRAIFNQVGISMDAQERYFTLWTNELLTVRRYLTLNKVVDLYKKGLVNESVLRQKLAYLRYVEPDASLIIADARLDIFATQAKQQMAIDKHLAAEQRKLADEEKKATLAHSKASEKAAKEEVKAIQELTKKDLAAYSDKNIIAFHRAGYLDLPAIVRVLRDRGFTDPTVITWIKTYTPPAKEEDVNNAIHFANKTSGTSGGTEKEATITGLPPNTDFLNR